LEDAVTAVRSARVDNLVVTRGGEPVLYAGEEGLFAISVPPVEVVNPTAAGDAFLAGLVAGLVRDEGWADSLRLAAAAGASVASIFGPDMGPCPDLHVLLDDACNINL
jgi:2-dehydro-3-deoxygluconokinase